MSRPTWIDSDYTDENVNPKIVNGVKMGEGDGTVSLLSLGAMCVEGWKRERWNPSNIPVVTVEVRLAPFLHLVPSLTVVQSCLTVPHLLFLVVEEQQRIMSTF